MQQAYYSYGEAVDRAASNVLRNATIARQRQVEQLQDLLYSLGNSIPEAWGTQTKALLTRREHSLDHLVGILTMEMHLDPEHPRYSVLSSLLLLAFTIKQAAAQLC